MSCRIAAWILLCLVAVCGCATVDAETRVFAARERVLIDQPGLYPEGIAIDSVRNQFVIGSMRQGAVYLVTPQGVARQLTRDARLCSVLGVAVDSARRRVWATNADVGVSERRSAGGPRSLAAVAAYGLEDGKTQGYWDLGALAPGPHAANGIAIDDAGTAYVTDSFSPVIYAVSGEGPARVLLRSDAFMGEGINLNGVAWHPDNYLLVIKKSDGALFRVPVPAPEKFERVAVSMTFNGGDGIVMLDERRALLIANQTENVKTNAAYLLASDDGWEHAVVREVLPLGSIYATNPVVVGRDLFVLHSQLDELLSHSSNDTSSQEAFIWDIGSFAPQGGDQ